MGSADCNLVALGNFFEPLSAALLLLETAVIAPVWVLIKLEAFLTALLATVLQLIEQ